MDNSIAILGRLPSLGLAELESLFGANAVVPLSKYVVEVKATPCEINYARLGGVVKLCKTLAVLDTVSWSDIEKFLLQVAPGHSDQMPQGKMHLGLSAYDIDGITNKELLKTGLKLKRAIQAHGKRSVHLVPNKSATLTTAQVLHNKLVGSNGWELVFSRHGNKSTIAQTVYIQDINGYTLRDRSRPSRDARVGMLPPKLAQIIINIAASSTKPAKGITLLDPFCGSGVILQEALLMGYNAYGTDIAERMINYSMNNLNWLRQKFEYTGEFKLETGDATHHIWQKPINLIACESYLGRAFSTFPTGEALSQTIADCNLIIKKFLKNISEQIETGTRLCLAIPAWQVKSGTFLHLSIIDRLEDLGYNQVSFRHCANKQLIYYRENQIVARELLVLRKNG